VGKLKLLIQEEQNDTRACNFLTLASAVPRSPAAFFAADSQWGEGRYHARGNGPRLRTTPDRHHESYPDAEGTDLRSFQDAKDEAVRALVEMAREILPGGAYRELTFKVRDESDRQLIQVVIKFELQAH
jgi:hypothetical protein